MPTLLFVSTNEAVTNIGHKAECIFVRLYNQIASYAYTIIFRKNENMFNIDGLLASLKGVFDNAFIDHVLWLGLNFDIPMSKLCDKVSCLLLMLMGDCLLLKVLYPSKEKTRLYFDSIHDHPRGSKYHYE